MPADQDDPTAGRPPFPLAPGRALPPHPATVVQKKPAFGTPAARPPHPATVVQKKPAFGAPAARPPHPATVVQPKPAFGAPAGRPPHPAMVVQRKPAIGTPGAVAPHSASIAQRTTLISSSSSSSSSSKKKEMSVRAMSELGESDYVRSKTVIDITMGEFAISTFYPIHSDSYATCMGVVIGAVEDYGVCLAHLDPVAAAFAKMDEGLFYTRSLDRMILMLKLRMDQDAEVFKRQKKAKLGSIDVLFFKDGYGALGKYELATYLSTKYDVRSMVDCTDAKGTKYPEVIAMPSTFCSAYVFLRKSGESFDVLEGKTVLHGKTDPAGNRVAEKLKRAREIVFVKDGQVDTEEP